jgi:hypothetical protein
MPPLCGVGISMPLNSLDKSVVQKYHGKELLTGKAA